LASFSRSSHIRQEFLHIFKEQILKKNLKIVAKKLNSNAAKFKMATKTKLAYVAKKTLVRLRTFDQFNYAFL
jgi:hypothetical protein